MLAWPSCCCTPVARRSAGGVSSIPDRSSLMRQLRRAGEGANPRGRRRSCARAARARRAARGWRCRAAAFLALHGAMVAEHTDDGEGELLRRVRAVAPRLPIAVGLDFHAHMTSRMIDNATVITGYRTYPHVDMAETAARAGRTLLRA